MRAWRAHRVLLLSLVTGCGARTGIPDPAPDARPADAAVVDLPEDGCRELANWTEVSPSEAPTSNTGVLACAKTCREAGAARVTLFCEGPVGLRSECFCVVGEKGEPVIAFGYRTCHITSFRSYSDNDATACARRFAEHPVPIADCLAEARGAECIDCCAR